MGLVETINKSGVCWPKEDSYETSSGKKKKKDQAGAGICKYEYLLLPYDKSR